MAIPKKTKIGTLGVRVYVAGNRESGTFATKAEASNWAARRATELRAEKKGHRGH